MGDGTPSAFLSKMLACLPAGEDCKHILFKFLFQWQLPADVQDHLAHSTALTICMMAEQADAYFILFGTLLNQPSFLVSNVDAVAIDLTRQRCSTKNNTRLFSINHGMELMEGDAPRTIARWPILPSKNIASGKRQC